jgi:hypothetical protein
VKVKEVATEAQDLGCGIIGSGTYEVPCRSSSYSSLSIPRNIRVVKCLSASARNISLHAAKECLEMAKKLAPVGVVCSVARLDQVDVSNGIRAICLFGLMTFIINCNEDDFDWSYSFIMLQMRLGRYAAVRARRISIPPRS